VKRGRQFRKNLLTSELAKVFFVTGAQTRCHAPRANNHAIAEGLRLTRSLTEEILQNSIASSSLKYGSTTMGATRYAMLDTAGSSAATARGMWL